MRDILKGFSDIQKDYWKAFTRTIGECSCKNCGAKKLTMTSKWKCTCSECSSEFDVKKPAKFPKNRSNQANWCATCCECGASMKFHRGGEFGAYICNKCGNILEV